MYFKITNEEENHNGLQYHDGLVKDILPFEKEGSCVPGGIYFADLEHIIEFFDWGIYIREVTIPPDAEFVKDPDNSKYRASQVFLGPRKNLKDVSTWEWLCELGLPIDLYSSCLFLFAIERGYVDVVKFLFDFKTSAIYSDDDSRNNLWFATSIICNSLDVVKLLVSKGNYKKLIKIILQNAINNENMEIVNYINNSNIIKDI